MDRQQIRQILSELLAEETGQSVPALPDETRIIEQFGLDSVDVVSLMMQVERRFRIRIPHDELEAVETVAALMNVVEDKLAHAVPGAE